MKLRNLRLKKFRLKGNGLKLKPYALKASLETIFFPTKKKIETVT